MTDADSRRGDPLASLRAARDQAESDVAAIQKKILEELAEALKQSKAKETAWNQASALVDVVRMQLDKCATERQQAIAATEFFQHIEHLESLALQKKREHDAMLERRRRLFGVSTDVDQSDEEEESEGAGATSIAKEVERSIEG